MFVVTDVRHPFLFWTTVELRAESDLSLSKERLTWGRFAAPALERRRLDVRKGETFTINAWRSEFRRGDRVPLDRVANKLALRAKWRTVAML